MFLAVTANSRGYYHALAEALQGYSYVVNHCGSNAFPEQQGRKKRHFVNFIKKLF
jgi:hypothetical protein